MRTYYKIGQAFIYIYDNNGKKVATLFKHSSHIEALNIEGLTQIND